MKFTTTSAASVLSLLSLTNALPAPAPLDTREPANIIRPTALSQYTVWTGAITHDTNRGLILKNNGASSDITTLGTFTIPAAAAGRTCEFGFSLPSSATVSGTGTFDVFTSIKPADGDTSGWPSGNLRDRYDGRVRAVVGGEAQSVEGILSPLGRPFKCPPAGAVVGGELVGAGDVVRVEWEGNFGPYFFWY
ncbi:hypothetical protein GQ43DRAFT_442877 [Delitschia confertaspora ATCC 74209]|uniref:Ubiquitin 3 binding protein But2 C-terminal domain-containing protein n=1 Tax=Delitschia confertaspora ATCC 74209 TaxID=1513339 RepID=A0A9P4MQ56_9PLEO|nr:hypothetical protein GQ43DRAFT_442877 [Delitschia confertaspora ATCC 74209]